MKAASDIVDKAGAPDTADAPEPLVPKRDRKCGHCETRKQESNSCYCARCRCFIDMRNRIIATLGTPAMLRDFLDIVDAKQITSCKQLEIVAKERDASKLLGMARMLQGFQKRDNQAEMLGRVIQALKSVNK